MPHLFISHSSKDDLAAEAMRTHLVQRGWNRKEIFLDFSVEGISAHEKWKASLAEANSGANALLCLASPDWLVSRESQVERRVAETLRDLGRRESRAVLVAILRDLKLDDLRAEDLSGEQIVDLSAAGEARLIRAELPGRPGEPGRYDHIRFNIQALEKIDRSLRQIGIAPESFEWLPRDPTRTSPYPGLEAFTENDAGVFFGRESRLAHTLEIIDRLCRRDGSRVLTIIAPSGVGKSSFLRAGLWPRLTRQSGVAPLVILRPGTGIMFGRPGGLIHSLPDWFQRAGRRVSAGNLHSRFASGSTKEALAFVLDEAAQAAGEGRTLVLAIDQAEELFDTSDQTRAREATEFLDALLALLATPPAAVECLVIFTIRSDSFDPLAAALVRASDAAEKLGAARRQALQETPFTLLPLAASAYRDVIRRPAQVAPKTDREIFEPALVDDLVDTFTGADALPLLAMTVEQLFAYYGSHQHITRADYKALYGVGASAEGPVRRALAEAYGMAGTAGTEETLKRLLIPALATWDPTAGEAGAARRRDAPVVGRSEDVEHRTALLGIAVEDLMQGGGREVVGQGLRAMPVVNARKGVVGKLEADPGGGELAGQPAMAVAIELQAERTPSRHAHIDQAQLGVDEVEVIMQAFTSSRAQESAIGLLAVPGLVGGTGFHRRDDMHPAGMVAAARQDLGNHLLLADVAVGNVLDGNAGSRGQLGGALAHTVTKRLGKSRIVEDADLPRRQECRHPFCITHPGQRTGDDDPVTLAQQPPQPSLPLPTSDASILSCLVPAWPG